MRLKILFFVLQCFVQQGIAQNIQHNIAGIVSDKFGNPVRGAHISVDESHLNTTSDSLGKFELLKLGTGSYHLHIRHIGYKTKDTVLLVKSNISGIHLVLDETFIELSKILIEESTFKLPNREQSQSMVVVDKDYILKYSGNTLMQTLSRISGVQSINTGVSISKPVIRGLGFNRVVVNENGMKQEGQQWGADHGLEVDQNNIERVEIIKGPASLLYGSDALAGVVNLWSALPPQVNSLSGSLMFTGRSNNDLGGIMANLQLNKNGYWAKARVSASNYADYRVPANQFVYNTFVLPIYNSRIKNTAGRENNLNFSFGINKNKASTAFSISYYDLKTGFFPGAHGIPMAYNLTPDLSNRNVDLPQQRVRHFKVVNNSIIRLGNHKLTLDLSYQKNFRQELSEPHNHGFGPIIMSNTELQFELQTYSAVMRFHHHINTKFSNIYGVSGQYQENKINGFSFLIPNFFSSGLGAFAFSKYSISNQLIFNAGLRYDYSNLKTLSYRQPIYNADNEIIDYWERAPALNKKFNNASGAVGISWFPKEDFNVKVNFGSSFRTPTAPELTSNGIHHGSFRHEVGDSALKPEKGYQFDIGFYYEKKKFALSVTPFFNYFNQFIFLDPTSKFSPLPDAGLIYQYNQADGIHTGFEFTTDYHVTKSLHLGLNGQFVYAYNLESGYNFPFIPPASCIADVQYEFESIGKWFEDTYVELSVLGTLSQDLTARNEFFTPGSVLLHVNFGTQINLGRFRMKLIGGIQNLLNSRYYMHLSRWRMINLPEPGRNFTISIMIPFQFKI
jgi:iron complex outermembrane receptor protein